MFLSKLKAPRCTSNLIVGVVVLLLTTTSVASNDPMLKQQAMGLKGQTFVLRIADDLVGGEATVSMDDDKRMSISMPNGNSEVDWQGRYFMSSSGTRYILRDVKYYEKEDLLKLRFDGSRQLFLQIAHAGKLSPDQFKSILYTIMLRPDESIEQARAENDKALMAKYFLPDPDLSKLPLSEQLKLLNMLRATGTIAPKPERIGGDLYVPFDLGVDNSIYNDLKVNKNQRLASTIEARFERITAISRHLDLPPPVRGLKLGWRDLHRSFLDQTSPATSERIELLIRTTTLRELSDGNLSALEMMQQSVLRVDGMKVTLIAFDPIGAR